MITGKFTDLVSKACEVATVEVNSNLEVVQSMGYRNVKSPNAVAIMDEHLKELRLTHNTP